MVFLEFPTFTQLIFKYFAVLHFHGTARQQSNIE